MAAKSITKIFINGKLMEGEHTNKMCNRQIFYLNLWFLCVRNENRLCVDFHAYTHRVKHHFLLVEHIVSTGARHASSKWLIWETGVSCDTLTSKAINWIFIWPNQVSVQTLGMHFFFNLWYDRWQPLEFNYKYVRTAKISAWTIPIVCW